MSILYCLFNMTRMLCIVSSMEFWRIYNATRFCQIWWATNTVRGICDAGKVRIHLCLDFEKGDVHFSFLGYCHVLFTWTVNWQCKLEKDAYNEMIAAQSGSVLVQLHISYVYCNLPQWHTSAIVGCLKLPTEGLFRLLIWKNIASHSLSNRQLSWGVWISSTCA